MDVLNELSQAVQNGLSKQVEALISTALSEGELPKNILEKGLLEGMSAMGDAFKENRVFIPEILMAARAMNFGMEQLKPHLAESVDMQGRVCLGTVKGDYHDIGKNLVCLMMESKGLEVIDLGVDVQADQFIQTAVKHNCDIIACSALLTTTMMEIKEIVAKAKAAGIRDRVKIMIGGAPVSEGFCAAAGADIYTPDAATAAHRAAELMKQKV